MKKKTYSPESTALEESVYALVGVMRNFTQRFPTKSTSIQHIENVLLTEGNAKSNGQVTTRVVTANERTTE